MIVKVEEVRVKPNGNYVVSAVCPYCGHREEAVVSPDGIIEENSFCNHFSEFVYYDDLPEEVDFRE